MVCLCLLRKSRSPLSSILPPSCESPCWWWSYSIPLGYKDLLVVQLVVGDFPVTEKMRERILPVFQEG